ncbi:MAG: glucokinase [Halioglobus sp.]|nr:glucokinase [Halioglobus sp.]
MRPSEATNTRLVADIGGTNTRLALFDYSAHTMRAQRHYINHEHTCLEVIIEDWLQGLDESPPREGCLAVAAPPPVKGRIDMLNIDWHFCVRTLKDRFGFHSLCCINDFESNAYALPHLTHNDVAILRSSDHPAGGKLATFGPGTGLGGSTLDTSSETPLAWASEPGHMGLSPATEQELALFQYLQAIYGEVYAELLLSGPGLRRLRQALAIIRGEDIPSLTSEEISTRALANECALCTDTLRSFCALLGSACGDFVLANGAFGGLYIAGGILPGMVDFLKDSSFADRFCAKGNMADHLSRVPLYVITASNTGLLGAAHAPMGSAYRP